MPTKSGLATFSDEVTEELNRMRARRDAMRSERDRLERELTAADDVIAALLRLRPDLRDAADVLVSSQKGKRTEVGPRLLTILRDHPGMAMPVPAIMSELERSSRAGLRKPSTSQVRNALRYLAQTSDEVLADRDAENRLTYRFNITLKPV